MMRQLWICAALAASLSACSIKSYPLPTKENQCAVKTYRVNPKLADNEWILTHDHSETAEIPRLGEYMQNRYEVDCNGIRKLTLMQDLSRVSNGHKRSYWNVVMQKEQDDIQQDKSPLSPQDLAVVKQQIDKYFPSISKLIVPARTSCSIPYPWTEGYGNVYNSKGNLLFRIAPQHPSDEYSPEGLRWDGKDMRVTIGDFLSGLLGGTIQGICTTTH